MPADIVLAFLVVMLMMFPMTVLLYIVLASYGLFKEYLKYRSSEYLLRNYRTQNMDQFLCQHRGHSVQTRTVQYGRQSHRVLVCRDCGDMSYGGHLAKPEIVKPRPRILKGGKPWVSPNSNRD